MYHKPVLYNEVIENMIKPEYNIYVDCTLGGGGHSEGILKNSKAKLIAIDQDDEAIKFSTKRLEKYSDRVKIFKNNFSNLKYVLYMAGYDKVDAILMDIGVSSNQLDKIDRGFSYKKEAFLDMRMNKEKELTAYEIVNKFTEEEIANIIFKYGQEPKARRIARYICKYREENEIKTTTQLAELVIRAIGKSMKKHPAKRTFQALRIYVNNELEVLEKTIDDAIELLNKGGRLLIITFHSLEDKIVKEKFRYYENPCTCPKDIPICVCKKKSYGKIINKKAIVASNSELESNNRAHSAQLRIFERI
ncbi:16S rRNA (cytosine(1402)-N(4))-methyltransferase RsmH [Sneathia sanguinegens]|uniref:Ribosomal RNA small subunit methyltransferase H n=1 Tax=Sneathia sanguinegens TaxID=40543 RepID=A0ABT7HIN4_9FUSO|nr:16S rRNA (cytosine(1402)-N(4))-methyltransferase RsmH [Sneathia sanguinegens]MDK9579927.1 16S rRNA (cytosine(1402)-N(4))-methyltransferase RsmH [Sneathia sanguinegens]